MRKNTKQAIVFGLVVAALGAYDIRRRSSIIDHYESRERQWQEHSRHLEERARAGEEYTAIVSSYVAAVNSTINAQSPDNLLELSFENMLGGPEPDLSITIGEGLRKQRAFLKIDGQTVEDYLTQKEKR